MKIIYSLLILALAFVIISCGTAENELIKPTDDPNTSLNESIVPEEGQPEFPKLGTKWIADPNGDCGFTKDTVFWAHDVFEKLRTERDVWIAVLCQKGIENISGTNNPRMWMVDWVRWFQLGSGENDWAVFVVFRPDKTPEEHRVLIERTYGLTWFSPVVYMPIMENIAMYANADDYDGALEALVREIEPLVTATMERKNLEP
jgi:hypothetical protein